MEVMSSALQAVQQVNAYFEKTNNITVKLERNITKVNNSFGTLVAVKKMNQLNNSIKQVNRSVMTVQSNLSNTGGGEKGLTLAKANILLSWAKNLMNFAGISNKINSSMNSLGTTIGNYLNPAITAFNNAIMFIANNFQLFLPLFWLLIVAVGIYSSAQIKAAAATILACAPLMHLLALVLAVVAVIYILVGAFNLLSGSSISILGVIVGAFYAFGQAVENIVLFCWNRIAAFANFLANVFVNPIAAIKVLFYDLRSNVLDILLSLMQGIETAINKIPRMQLDLTSNLRTQLETVRLAASKAKSEAQLVEVMQTKGMGSLTEAYSRGYSIGAAGFKSGSIFSANNTLDSINNSTAMVAANTAQMNNSLDVSSEDLSYLRDLAEMEAINRFTTAEIKVDMTNNNRIDSDRDIDSVMDQFAMRLMGALNTVKEGV